MAFGPPVCALRLSLRVADPTAGAQGAECTRNSGIAARFQQRSSKVHDRGGTPLRRELGNKQCCIATSTRS